MYDIIRSRQQTMRTQDAWQFGAEIVRGRKRNSRIRVAHQVNLSHQADAARAGDDVVIINQALQGLPQVVADQFRILDQFFAFDDVQIGQCNRARDRMCTER